MFTPLRTLRIEGPRPMTLEEVAAATGFSVGHLSEVETGQCGAGKRLIAALARCFRVDLPTMREVCKRSRRRKSA